MVPAPIIVAPSQNWDGVDGPWSSFAFQVGMPSQVANVFVGTGSYQQLVVLPQGCDPPVDPTNCVTLRGGEFNISQSMSWRNYTIISSTTIGSAIYDIGIENRLGLAGRGIFGYDVMTLGFLGMGGPTLASQSIGAIATKDFFLGMLGLNPRPANFSNYNNPTPSYLQKLRSGNFTTSLSWSYTAGNQYRLDQVLGSLVLGGFDTSKFVPNNVSWPFDSRDVVDLSVDIQSITSISSSSQASLLPTTIRAYMDSSVPHIWLPLKACQMFEKEFGITWDDNIEHYLINDTQHTKLVADAANIVFALGGLTSNQTINITLPYAAFDLTLSPPLVDNSTRYFPLKRAANDTQYTLGRTFFQEAYLTADYERHNFSVSQRSWDPNARSHVVAILPPSDKMLVTSKKLTLGTIVGIAVGCIVGFAIAGTLVYVFIIKPCWQRRQRRQRRLPGELGKPELDSTPVDGQMNRTEVMNSNTELFEIGDREVPGHGMNNEEMQSHEVIGTSRLVFELPVREEVAAEIGS